MGMCEPCTRDPASREGEATGPDRPTPSTPRMHRRCSNGSHKHHDQNPSPTHVDINDPVLQEIIAEAVAARMAAEKAAQKSADGGKIDTTIIRAFEKKGFKDIVLFDRTKTLAQQPEVAVLTYQKWMELGRRVKEGEHSLRIKGYRVRLFQPGSLPPRNGKLTSPR